jgi:hypothetical protein
MHGWRQKGSHHMNRGHHRIEKHRRPIERHSRHNSHYTTRLLTPQDGSVGLSIYYRGYF